MGVEIKIDVNKESTLKENVWKVIDIMRTLTDQDISTLAFLDMKEQWRDMMIESTDKLLKGGVFPQKKDIQNISPWEMICYYKLTTNAWDCDVSLITTVLYILAFDFVLTSGRKMQRTYKNNKFKYCFRGENCYEYRGDTMNSYATSIHEYLEKFPGFCNKNPKDMSKVENFLNELKKEKYSWEACILDHYSDLVSVLPVEAKMFIRLNHTVGNFLPVPFSEAGKEFNRPRGFGKTADYWDLALLAIYKSYVEKNDVDLKDMLRSDTNMELCKIWLNNFDSWDDFVERNYMQDFVTVSNDKHRKYGLPRELWEGHFINYIDGNAKPENERQYIQFFTNASAWIAARGIRIAIEVKKYLDWKGIKNWIKRQLEF